jgi:hypothetical protein
MTTRVRLKRKAESETRTRALRLRYEPVPGLKATVQQPWKRMLELLDNGTVQRYDDCGSVVWEKDIREMRACPKLPAEIWFRILITAGLSDDVYTLEWFFCLRRVNKMWRDIIDTEPRMLQLFRHWIWCFDEWTEFESDPHGWHVSRLERCIAGLTPPLPEETWTQILVLAGQSITQAAEIPAFFALQRVNKLFRAILSDDIMIAVWQRMCILLDYEKSQPVDYIFPDQFWLDPLANLAAVFELTTLDSQNPYIPRSLAVLMPPEIWNSANAWWFVMDRAVRYQEKRWLKLHVGELWDFEKGRHCTTWQHVFTRWSESWDSVLRLHSNLSDDCPIGAAKRAQREPIIIQTIDALARDGLPEMTLENIEWLRSYAVALAGFGSEMWTLGAHTNETWRRVFYNVSHWACEIEGFGQESGRFRTEALRVYEMFTEARNRARQRIRELPGQEEWVPLFASRKDRSVLLSVDFSLV